MEITAFQLRAGIRMKARAGSSHVTGLCITECDCFLRLVYSTCVLELFHRYGQTGARGWYTFPTVASTDS